MKGKSIVDKGEKRTDKSVKKKDSHVVMTKKRCYFVMKDGLEIFCLIILQCKESSPTMLSVLLYLSQSHKLKI